jgi:hypothetical protein
MVLGKSLRNLSTLLMQSQCLKTMGIYIVFFSLKCDIIHKRVKIHPTNSKN